MSGSLVNFLCNGFRAVQETRKRSIAGGLKGDGLKQRIEAGRYPGIVKTRRDVFEQRAYLERTSEKSARGVFFYYSARAGHERDATKRAPAARRPLM